MSGITQRSARGGQDPHERVLRRVRIIVLPVHRLHIGSPSAFARETVKTLIKQLEEGGHKVVYGDSVTGQVRDSSDPEGSSV